jgi:hypothetical protein
MSAEVRRALRFGDFTALDAGSAHAHPFWSAIYKGLHGLQVYIPAAASNVVCVRDVIAKARAFAADIACLCHVTNSSFFSLCGAGTAVGALLGAHYRLAESPV